MKTQAQGKAQLQLLAQQKAEHAWAVLGEEASDLCIEADGYTEGTLLLVELDGSRQVQKLQEATSWILEVVEQYLAIGIAPAVLQAEMQRAEQWRQSLTLKSQELQRRALEMEARREQIQELEDNLLQEKEQLESLANQMKASQIKASQTKPSPAESAQAKESSA